MNIIMNVETANRLQNLRKKNGYSQEELAEKIGISRQAVSKWERAEASPDTDNLILLARLYGVTLDELLNTESIPMPNSEGISLSKDYYTSTSDDGEIYPEGHPRHSNWENPADINNHSANNSEEVHNYSANSSEAANNAENSEKKSVIGNVAKNVAGAIGDAIDTTAASLREGKENAPENGGDNGKSYANAFEKNFTAFGRRMQGVGKELESDLKTLGRDIEESIKSESSEQKRREERRERREELREQRMKEHGEREKYPPNLMDKLYPILVTMLFLCTVFINDNLAAITWMVFLTIPIYYVFSHNVKSYHARKSDFFHSAKAFLDGTFPLFIVILFLLLVISDSEGPECTLLFGFIPIYYICSYHFSKYIDKEKSFIMALKGVLDACVPIAAGILFVIMMCFEWFALGFVLLLCVPVYYIVSSHIVKNIQNGKSGKTALLESCVPIAAVAIIGIVAIFARLT